MKVTTVKTALLWFLIQCVLLRGHETVEWSALLDLRFSLGLRAINWPLKGDPCINWTGVVCQNGRVVEINISGLKRTRIGRLNPRFSVDSLVNLTLLRSFNASSFSLDGSIPNWFGDKLNLLQVLDLRSCSVSGLVPQSLGNMSSLRELYLSGNNLTGNIPSTLGNLRELSVMDLSNNMFYGTIPLLGNFNLTLINISTNYLQGNPPDLRGGINFILEHNCLQGTVSPNQRTLEDCRLFYAERGLSFDDFAHTAKKWIYVVAAGVACGFCFIVALVLVIVLVARKRHRGTTNPANLKGCSVIFSGESFTYEQLLNATGGFSETNLIKNGHSGDLFKGCLETGIPIVVKRVDLSCFKKESYLIELDLLSKVVHSHTTTSRLVPLIGHSLEGEHEKLLVYKYMPNTDLATSLFRVVTISDDGNDLVSLDWITRLKIAIGAAEALSYLHHECNPPLLHRDVQASSILLDDKFEVRLGSLSEVRPQDHHKSHQNVLTRGLHDQQLPSSDPDELATTTGYDVYCFGKVLLELVTGKLGISKMNDGTTKAWIDETLHYISIHDKELVTNIIDPSLIIDEDLLEEVWAMAIVARSCVNPNSLQRPPMKYVHRALENPMKVVRQNSRSSSRHKIATLSRTASFFGNWRCSSLEQGHAPDNGFGEVGSRGSSKIEHSISGKRSSSEIFPEPLELQDDQH